MSNLQLTTDRPKARKKETPRRSAPTPLSTLTFTPLAWMKLNWFLRRTPNEVCCLGISEPGDLMRVSDVKFLPQFNSPGFTRFEDQPLSDYLLDCVEAGIPQEQIIRIWIHTHPGNSASPSGTDWETFREKFGHMEWAAMFILAKGGDTSCHFRVNTGSLVVERTLDVEVDWSYPTNGLTLPPATELEAIYDACCKPFPPSTFKWKGDDDKGSKPNHSATVGSHTYRYDPEAGEYRWFRRGTDVQDTPPSREVYDLTPDIIRPSGTDTNAELSVLSPGRTFHPIGDDDSKVQGVLNSESLKARIVNTFLATGRSVERMSDEDAENFWNELSADERGKLLTYWQQFTRSDPDEVPITVYDPDHEMGDVPTISNIFSER